MLYNKSFVLDISVDDFYIETLLVAKWGILKCQMSLRQGNKLN